MARPTRNVWVAGAFLVLCFVLGGSSRFQLLPHLALRLASIASIAQALWSMTPDDRQRVRPFALAVMAFGGLMTLQLIPLPPGLWNALPGHGYYAEALQQVELDDHWRPWSMSPDLTLNSLLALLPVLAAVLLFAPLDATGRRWLLDGLLACIAVGALWSVLQIVTGSFYLYPYNNHGTGVGPFANRNHQGLLLAIGIVLILGRWRLSGYRTRHNPAQSAIMLGIVAAIFPLLIVTGSRTALVAGVVALLLGAWTFGRAIVMQQTGWVRLWVSLAALAAVVLAFGIGMGSSRQLAVERLLETGSTMSTTELRTANLPAVIEAAKTFLPIGAGFGTFDAVFRRFESDTLLRPSYFNHAHSDPLELLIEGGLPALALMVAALAWIAYRAKVLARSSTRSSSIIRAQIGVGGLILLLLGSFVDYPLRTPFLAVLAVLFATWAADGEADEPAGGRSWHP